MIRVDESADGKRIRLRFPGRKAVELHGLDASWLGGILLDRARFQVAKPADDPKRIACDKRETLA